LSVRKVARVEYPLTINPGMTLASRHSINGSALISAA
jgi:hypothetical protein